jgi:Xaa-Pro aminopeptidase
MKSQNLLIVADSDHDANMLYATGMFVPDPFVFLRTRGRNYILMNDLEIDRARRQAPHCHVLSLSQYQKKLHANGVKNPGFPQVLPLLFKEKKIRQVLVPHNFPHGLAAQLQRARIGVKAATGSFFPAG